MGNRAIRLVTVFATALLVLALDQASKAWIVAGMAPREVRPVIEGLVRLRVTENTGAAFGIFQGSTWALSIAAFAIIVAIIFSVTRMGKGTLPMVLALGLVLGGAVGNLIDRLRLGYVVDFIDVYGLRLNINNTVYTWPVFNVADSAITTGVILLMIALVFAKGEEPAEPETMRVAPERLSYIKGELSSPPDEGQAGSPVTYSPRPLKEPTPAGWAGLLLLLGGFLFMALRSATKNQ